MALDGFDWVRFAGWYDVGGTQIRLFAALRDRRRERNKTVVSIACIVETICAFRTFPDADNCGHGDGREIDDAWLMDRLLWARSIAP